MHSHPSERAFRCRCANADAGICPTRSCRSGRSAAISLSSGPEQDLAQDQESVRPGRAAVQGRGRAMIHRLVKAPRGKHIGKRLDKPAASEAEHFMAQTAAPSWTCAISARCLSTKRACTSSKAGAKRGLRLQPALSAKSGWPGDDARWPAPAHRHEIGFDGFDGAVRQQSRMS